MIWLPYTECRAFRGTEGEAHTIGSHYQGRPAVPPRISGARSFLGILRTACEVRPTCGPCVCVSRVSHVCPGVFFPVKRHGHRYQYEYRARVLKELSSQVKSSHDLT